MDICMTEYTDCDVVSRPRSEGPQDIRNRWRYQNPMMTRYLAIWLPQSKAILGDFKKAARGYMLPESWRTLIRLRISKEGRGRVLLRVRCDHRLSLVSVKESGRSVKCLSPSPREKRLDCTYGGEADPQLSTLQYCSEREKKPDVDTRGCTRPARGRPAWSCVARM